MTDQPEDFPSRYAALRERAQAVNHDLRVIVAPGAVKAGQQFTLKPFEAEALELGPALGRIEEYLGTDTASRRGELHRKLAEAEVASAAALEAWHDARKAARDARDAVDNDLMEELDEGDTVIDPEKPLTVRAGVLRQTLADTTGDSEADQAKAKALLERIRDLPDDALVDVEPELEDEEPPQ